MHGASGIRPPKPMAKLATVISSVSDEAVKMSHEHNITVIPCGYPVQFLGDFMHTCMRWTLCLVNGYAV
jgi:hypothetical protein